MPHNKLTVAMKIMIKKQHSYHNDICHRNIFNRLCNCFEPPTPANLESLLPEISLLSIETKAHFIVTYNPICQGQ